MQSSDLLGDAFGRIPGIVRRAVDGLDAVALTWRVEAGSNPIGWLVWHLARVQDDHVAELVDGEQVWLAGAWAARFALPEGTTETGFGHTADQVAAVRPESVDVLLAYLDHVTDRTHEVLAATTADDLDQVVDPSWDPPVTMGVRLVSVLADGLQHAGQAAYLRGVMDRSDRG